MVKLSRILTINVIILLIGISVISSAKDINFKKNIIEYPEVEDLNDEIELISFIWGTAFSVERTGYIFNKPIKISPWKTMIHIIGIKLPTPHSYNMLFYDNPNWIIKISHFFGIIKQRSQCSYDVFGIAIGDIGLIKW